MEGFSLQNRPSRNSKFTKFSSRPIGKLGLFWNATKQRSLWRIFRYILCSIDRFHCHATKKLIGNRPVEEAKKMKCYKRLILHNLSKSQVFVAHSFWVICRNVSRTFVELCMETPCWCTVLEFTFSKKDLSFHSKTSIHADKYIF